MPILHIQYGNTAGQTVDGQAIQFPPQITLLNKGPLIQVSVGLEQNLAEQLIQQGQVIPAPQSGLGLIDTGASVTCVDDALARNLNLPVIDVVQMTSASHAAIPQNVYPIQLEIIGYPIKINVPRAMGANLSAQGIVALIGRDFLQHGTLFYNGFTGAITLSI